MMKVWNWMDGRKSYLTAILLVIWGGLLQQGFIDQHAYELGLTVLGAVGIASLRHSISKLE